MSFDQQVQQWVQLDDQIKTLNEKIRQLRDHRQQLTERLVQQKEVGSTVSMADGKLKFVSVNVSHPLTFKYVEKCLGEIIPNKDQVVKIMDYIKKNRDIKQVQDIKRFC